MVVLCMVCVVVDAPQRTKLALSERTTDELTKNGERDQAARTFELNEMKKQIASLTDQLKAKTDDAAALQRKVDEYLQK